MNVRDNTGHVIPEPVFGPSEEYAAMSAAAAKKIEAQADLIGAFTAILFILAIFGLTVSAALVWAIWKALL